MMNSTDNTSADITMNGMKLKEVSRFKYVGATMSQDGTSNADNRIMLAMAAAYIARLITGGITCLSASPPNTVPT
ncbi:hypothetical protein DPMN_103203 [Dreissena polymorpha]|uniref:Uncharacterized protein n=1 Tax=Dreissena polymorpha TaxID=45954 RepID=A0A9D4JYZ4_DREPO|nr:hypothetical protein DPMN_103203 [Dreissena polymorpha]